MRVQVIVLLMNFLSLSEVYAQGAPFSQKYDSVIYDKVQINGVLTTGTKKDIIKKIGRPQKITKYRSDANNDHWSEYRYGRTILQVSDDGSFYGFELNTRAFIWRYGTDSIRVGDLVSQLCKYFPASCRTMKAEKSDVLRVRCQATDGYIHFRAKNNIITSIVTWQDL